MGTVTGYRLSDGPPVFHAIGDFPYDPDEDKVCCGLCGRWFRALAAHLSQAGRVEGGELLPVPRGRTRLRLRVAQPVTPGEHAATLTLTLRSRSGQVVSRVSRAIVLRR